MIFVLGKTCAGKDTVVKKLIEKYGYKKLITYTTRPQRKGEVQDKTYHYISEEEFLEKINSGFFLEYKKYDTALGTWYYGSAKEDYLKADNKTVAIITPSGYEDVLAEFRKNSSCNERHISIYLYANNKTILRRLKKRGDDEKEAERRIKEDNKDFMYVVNVADKIIYNNTDGCIDEIVDMIHEYIESVS